MTQFIFFRTIYFRTFGVAILTAVLLLSACAPVSTPQPTPDMDAAITQVVATIYAGGTQTALFVPPTAFPTETPILQPTAVRTPPALPAIYASTLLNPLDTPHAYIQDTCQALKSKWDSSNAQPGTVVMVIMIHGIAKGNAAKSQDISTADFKKLMNDLKDQGFTAIFTQQLFDFLDHNAKIPDRSVLLIQDDRHTAQNYNEIFRPYWEKWQWPVINAWNNTNDSITKTYLPENAALAKEGWVDYQSHGIIHNINMNDNSTDEFLKGELQGSMDAITANFSKAPIAIIWPGGDFGKKPVEAARLYGYKLGFTINPRGPLMFNWVPLADAGDPMRPSYIPDGSIADPLMTLPRYWDTDARSHLDTVRKIGNEARAYAEKNKAVELEYYDIVCAPSYGAMP